jgi:phosphohistidine phosphatase
MRLLTLIRHAKSSWDSAALTDSERPLNPRGRRDAPAMAQRAAHMIGKPRRVVSSPALRAISTARIFCEVLGIPSEEIIVKPSIYEATADTLLDLVRDLDDQDRHVMLFGHNPGFTELAHLLAPCSFDELPTCGIAHFSIAARTWRDIIPDGAKLLRYAYPKEPDAS